MERGDAKALYFAIPLTVTLFFMFLITTSDNIERQAMAQTLKNTVNSNLSLSSTRTHNLNEPQSVTNSSNISKAMPTQNIGLSGPTNVTGGAAKDHPPTVSNITMPINLTNPVQVELKANDPDKNDTFTFYIVRLPVHGKLASIQGENVTYTPDSAFLSDSFIYRAKDSTGLNSTNNGTVTLDHPPIVFNRVIGMNGTNPIKFKLNGSDPDTGDKLTFSITQMPLNALFSDLTGNSATYAPKPGFIGQDKFAYRAVDPKGLSSKNGTVLINVGKPLPKTINLNTTVPIVAPGQLDAFAGILQWSTFATAITLVIPLSLMLILTYLQGRAIGKGSNIPQFAVGQFYRLLVAVGVILTVLLIIVYLNTMIMIVPLQSQQTLLETQKNFLTIVGTAFASLVAFYFGTRGNAERTTTITKPEAGQKALEVIDVNPIDGSMGVEVESPVTATFSAPIRSSSINPNTFSVKDVNGNPVQGKLTLTDNKTTIRFSPVLPLNRNNRYTVTATKGLMDISGATITADKEWHFTTVA
jgi:hypothetical protein